MKKKITYEVEGLSVVTEGNRIPTSDRTFEIHGFETDETDTPVLNYAEIEALHELTGMLLIGGK